MPLATRSDRAGNALDASAAGRGAPGEVCFRLATPDDDPALRRLLRENPMGGDIRLSLEREPSYFAAAGIEGADHRTIVAVEDGRVVCAGSISARWRFVNGRPTWVGYLGGLRLDAACRNRASIVRGGYALFRQLHEDGACVGPAVPAEGLAGVNARRSSSPTAGTAGPTDERCATPGELAGLGHAPPAVYLTSIVADNLPARRLLERGLPGMPTYHFVGEVVTLVIRRRRHGHLTDGGSLPRRQMRVARLSLHYGSEALVPKIVEVLNHGPARGQFAPVWSADDLRCLERRAGLRPADFRLVRSGDGTPVACAALWDQRSVKQTVVRGYSPRLRRLRPILNAYAAVAGRPRLPAVGRPIAHAFVSHVVADPGEPQVLEWLVRLLHGPANTRRVDYLTLGLDARDPRLPHLRRAFGPREYRSRLYAVHWDDAGAAVARSLDGRPVAPEVALL